MSKVDIDKLVVTIVEEMNCHTMLGEDVRYGLQRQGLKVENGEIVELEPEKRTICYADMDNFDSLFNAVEFVDLNKFKKIQDTIDSFDVDKMVEKFKSHLRENKIMFEFANLYDFYRQGILDTLAEIKKISK